MLSPLCIPTYPVKKEAPMMYKLTYIALLLGWALPAGAQEVITYDQAATQALQQNLAVQIVKNETAIAQNNNSIGNAGMLPRLDFEAAGSYANNNTNQEYQSAPSVNRRGVVSNGINSGIILSWTIFDGLRMFAAKNRLTAEEQASQYRLKQQIEATLLEVNAAYFELVKQKQQINATKEAITIYEERLLIAETRVTIGKASKTDLLQAKVDLNEQKSILLRSQAIYREAQALLNRLMGKPAETEFDVSDEITFNYTPSYSDIKAGMRTRNNSILFAETNISIAESLKKEIAAMRYPVLSVNTSYNFTRTSNQAGFVLLNQNVGLNAGFTFSWNLFNGFNTHRQVKNAELNIVNSNLQLQDMQRQTEMELVQAWRNFETAKEILVLEEESYTLAKENMELSLERFKLGNMTTVEFKQTQITLQDVQTRLVNARYDAKTAETKLMQLNGDLVK